MVEVAYEKCGIGTSAGGLLVDLPSLMYASLRYAPCASLDHTNPMGPPRAISLRRFLRAMGDGKAAHRTCSPRPRLADCLSYVSLGIMNAHPNYFAQGVARGLLAHIIKVAEGLDTPIRRLSSALNIDSFPLYTRAGFVPRCVYHDIALTVLEEGIVGLAERDAGETASSTCRR